MKRSIRTLRKMLPRLKPESFLFVLDVDDVMNDLDAGFAASTISK